MALYFNQANQDHAARYFGPSYWVATEVTNERHLVTLTGYVKLDNFAGFPEGEDNARWYEDRLVLDLYFPIHLVDEWFRLELWFCKVRVEPSGP